MSEPLAEYQTKGVRGAPSPPSYGAHWTAARRGRLKLFGDRAELGPWRIDFAVVTEATLWRARTQLGLVAPILGLRTANDSFQFGLNPWSKVPDHLPLEVQHRNIRMRYTTYSWIIRALLALVIVWVLWDVING